MAKYYLDIEANGLLHDATKTWIIGVTDIDTRVRRYWLDGDPGWQKVFEDAELMVGHNIAGYDRPLLKKLYGYDFPKGCNVHDTLLMSQILDYRRFGSAGHSLNAWGDYLGLPKLDNSDDDFFLAYSKKMQEYWERDMELGLEVYLVLLKELKELSARAPLIKTYIRAEHAVAKWAAAASLHGWPFDKEAGEKLLVALEKDLAIAYENLNKKLGTKCVAVDMVKGEVAVKRPKWTKMGFYDAHTARWFNIDPCSGFEGEERMVVGEYCRVEFKPLSLDSVADVKLFLFRNGWVPTEWNYKFNEETKRKEKTSPKITEDSLEFLGGDGKLYLDFLVTRSRHGILKTWLENVDENGMLHGSCMTIGTPSMRSSHKIIVNVPSADSKWGKEMRSLFRCLPGWKLIGCDSSGNQARGLAHYLKNQEFTEALINGKSEDGTDIHSSNARKIDKILSSMGISWSDYLTSTGTPEDELNKAKRGVAKRILYAFLFGAGGDKLWSYIFSTMDSTKGNKFKAAFVNEVPGFQNLLDRLEAIYGKTRQTGDGYIPSLAGNKIYVDSFHKLLVYLLQAAEKITCAAAVMLTMQNLEAEDIPYVPLIMYHDEVDFMVPAEFAERARDIGKQAFIDGPKLFGVDIMDGDGKIGDNWYEIH